MRVPLLGCPVLLKEIDEEVFDDELTPVLSGGEEELDVIGDVGEPLVVELLVTGSDELGADEEAELEVTGDVGEPLVVELLWYGGDELADAEELGLVVIGDVGGPLVDELESGTDDELDKTGGL